MHLASTLLNSITLYALVSSANAYLDPPTNYHLAHRSLGDTDLDLFARDIDGEGPWLFERTPTGRNNDRKSPPRNPIVPSQKTSKKKNDEVLRPPDAPKADTRPTCLGPYGEEECTAGCRCISGQLKCPQKIMSACGDWNFSGCKCS